MAKTESPLRNGIALRAYSPRRQRLEAQKSHLELEQALDELRIHDDELQKLHAFQRRLHNEETELRESALAKAHAVALDKAQQDREALRREAEAVLQRHFAEQEAERRRKEEEERLRQEKEAQEKAERDRKLQMERERLRRIEEERVRAEAERQHQEEENAKLAEKERQRKEEAQRREEIQRLEEEATRKKAELELEERAERQAQRAAVIESSSPEKLHQEYIALYFKIKSWKNKYWEEIRQQAKEHKNSGIKEAVGEARRVIRAEIGKLSAGDKIVNSMASKKLKDILRTFSQTPTPVVGTRLPVNDFLPPSLHLNDDNQTTITDQAAYFLCVLAQQVVKIFTSYVHGAPERAEPIGVLLTSIFAQDFLQFTRVGTDQKQSLFPILLAKYHRVCPALFGITAPQNTLTGKKKMGWALSPPAEDGQPKTTFVTDQTHYDRMTGLAIGYSSFGLRNFSNASSMSNPYPPVHFWKSLAQIINLPPSEVQPTHVCVLRNMFGHGGIGRFLLFFGAVGVAVLREAFIEFPRRLPTDMQQNSFVRELQVYVELLGEKEHLHLA